MCTRELLTDQATGKKHAVDCHLGFKQPGVKIAQWRQVWPPRKCIESTEHSQEILVICPDALDGHGRVGSLIHVVYPPSQ